ncbi:hypothetical protein AVEN_34939-1 [Araneus ventricosus]|uniref:Uncharacterized protein n=1 Tax=Araneus ventricosus TaxID=182803 RepID=A0A4Y2GB91_ARAVE|nr:hypothetical protein AVEN_34939-1 [Araneus ventricosus]
MFVRNKTWFETVQDELPRDHSRGPGLSAKYQNAILLGRNASPDPKILTSLLSFLSPEKQKSISSSKRKPTFLSNAKGLVISQMAFHFTKLQKSPTSIHPGLLPLPQRLIWRPSLSKVHLLYSPKNTALYTPRHVGDSVNQHLL